MKLGDFNSDAVLSFFFCCEKFWKPFRNWISESVLSKTLQELPNIGLPRAAILGEGTGLCLGEKTSSLFMHGYF